MRESVEEDQAALIEAIHDASDADKAKLVAFSRQYRPARREERERARLSLGDPRD